MLDLMYLLTDYCEGIGPIVSFIKLGIMPIIQIGIPIILIVMGSIDLGKAVISSDEKEIKGATSKIIKKIIIAVVIFLLPFLVNLIMNLVSKANVTPSTNQDKNTTSNSGYNNNNKTQGNNETNNSGLIKGNTDWFKCWTSIN